MEIINVAQHFHKELVGNCRIVQLLETQIDLLWEKLSKQEALRDTALKYDIGEFWANC